MTLWLSLRVAWRALRVHKMRSILTILGIIVGVAAVVCMVSVGLGAQAQVSEKIRTLGANLLLITPGAQASGGARLEAGTRHTLTEEDALAIRKEIAAVQVAAPVLSRRAQVVAGNRNWSSLVAGVKPDYLVAREWPVLHGRPFTAEELDGGAKVAVIGDVIAEELFRAKRRSEKRFGSAMCHSRSWVSSIRKGTARWAATRTTWFSSRCRPPRAACWGRCAATRGKRSIS